MKIIQSKGKYKVFLKLPEEHTLLKNILLMAGESEPDIACIFPKRNIYVIKNISENFIRAFALLTGVSVKHLNNLYL